MLDLKVIIEIICLPLNKNNVYLEQFWHEGMLHLNNPKSNAQAQLIYKQTNTFYLAMPSYL